jgi:toxin ParE1/3/4
VSRLTRTGRAEEDLIEIWTYIAQENLAAADRVLDRIDAVCGGLAEHPRMGPARPYLAEELRCFVAGPYLVLYREAPDGVEIVRVIHGARHLPAAFRDT